jgi:hypothetical protein
MYAYVKCHNLKALEKYRVVVISSRAVYSWGPDCTLSVAILRLSWLS